jgi:hypothetical protein
MTVTFTIPSIEKHDCNKSIRNDSEFSIYNIAEADLLDLVIDARSAGLKLTPALVEMINRACYHDMHCGGQFLMLTADEEFLDALAWHDTLDD